ncbi:MAG: hypothetical protein ACR2QO_05275 [Acidimicrobiales bacterium]
MSVRSLVVLLVCVLVAASCSISVDDAARPVDDAPEDLVNPTTTTAATTEPDEDDSFELVLMYLNSNGRRVPISRPRDTAPAVQDVLDGLVTQPTEAEQAAHTENPITTQLLPSMAPTDGGMEGDVLRVNVAGPELRAIATETPESLPLIYGQIVCSILALEDTPIGLIEVFDEEGRINALPAGGAVAPIEGPVGEDSYNDCATAAEIAAAEAEADEAVEGDEPADG